MFCLKEEAISQLWKMVASAQCKTEIFFWLHGVAYGIVDPQIGTESTPLALEAWSQQLDLPESVMDFLFFLI